MRIERLPQHWPDAPPGQQIKGLQTTLSYVDPKDFFWSINILQWFGFMTKSQKKKFFKKYRTINCITYEEWMRKTR